MNEARALIFGAQMLLTGFCLGYAANAMGWLS